MRGRFDTVIYIATAPIRLFGRSRWFRIALGAASIAGLCFAATLWALDRFLPADSKVETAMAPLQPPPPLQAVTSSSYVIAPVAVALAAIQRSMDAAAFVLRDFGTAERKELELNVDHAADAVEALLAEGLERAQNSYNT
jgi:hypothetical protein